MTQAQTHRGLGSFGSGAIFCGGGGGLCRLIGIAAAAVVALAGPALAQGQALEELRSRYPAVKTHDPHGRILTVWGQPMTRGETPREAAEEWVFWYGAVFGSALDLEEFREVTLRNAPEGKERRVFMYRQTVDELPVVGSSFRVMTEGDPEGGPAEVVYVAGRVAIRPAGGVAEPTVTPAAALAAAAAHPKGREMLLWSDPELVAIYDDAPRGEALAYPAWRLSGGGAGESFTFYVHAVTGDVARYHSNSIHATDQVQGAVTGNATPAEADPDLGPDTFAATATSCPNDADEFDLRDTWVTAKAAGNVVGSGWTDAAGDYTLNITGANSVDVFAELKGPVWFVLDGEQNEWGDEIAPLAHAGNPVTLPATGVDLEFNPSPAEETTAHVNAHRMMARTWRWLDLNEGAVPVVPVVVNDAAGQCNARFRSPAATGTPYTESGHLSFFPVTPGCANYAYSTIVAHEYGHFIAFHLMGIGTGLPATGSFHEGFADALAFLVFDTEILGQDAKGCGAHIRELLVTNPAYPMCPPPPYWWMFEPHEQGELLGALWLDIRSDLGATATRELFLDWIYIAQVPAVHDQGVCGAPPGFFVPQSADPGTLIDLLSVANEDQVAAICAIFFNRGISHPDPSPNPCDPDGAGRFCYADCDGSATLDFWDFFCFQDAYLTGDSYADCDGDRELTFFDVLCFHNEFARGCP